MTIGNPAYCLFLYLIGVKLFFTLQKELAEKIGLLSEAHARAKGYEFKNDPTIDPHFDYPALRGRLQLALAIDTSQFGRTFQDR